MSVSYWNDSSNGKTVQKDIVIIGGGIAGLSSAYWLHKEDHSLRIAIVEKYELAGGATGRNAGFITCGSVEHFNRLHEKHGEEEASAIWKFSEANLSLLKDEIIQDKAKDLLFEQKGSFSLASSDHEFLELKDSSFIMKKLGINVDIISKNDIENRLNAKGFVGGIQYLDDGSVHPVKMLSEIRNKIEGKVDILENHEVFEVSDYAGNKLVKTNKVSIEAPMVVYATNGYSPLLHPFFKDKIFPTRGQILITEKVPHFMEAPCYANFVLDYFRQLPTGELIIGGFRQLQKDVEVGYSDETTEVIQKALESFLADHLPSVASKKITHRWSGIMGFSIDGQPMVGAIPGDEQSYFIGGFTAHGLGLSFHSGKVLADSVFGRTIPPFISARRLGH